MRTVQPSIRQFQQCRRYAEAARPRLVPILPDASLESFRRQAFDPEVPVLLPRAIFSSLPATAKWFNKAKQGGLDCELNQRYLSRHEDVTVPVEVTNGERFARLDQPLATFLELSKATGSIAQIYIAQARLADLPSELRADVPTPELVLSAGKGDVYDTSIWLGRAPTYTPLHRDPNPNLFVQLAGKKLVRLYKPSIGRAIYHCVQEKTGSLGNDTMRGEEMMQGKERVLLEQEVWTNDSGYLDHAWDAEVGSGDGLFIPKGWWHSVKGVGDGMTGSVNWWFR